MPCSRDESGLVEHERGDAGGGGAEGGVDNGRDHGDAVLGVGDAALYHQECIRTYSFSGINSVILHLHQ